MSKINENETQQFVNQWVLDTVREKYADDIALVISHALWRIDPTPPAFSYFVPITDKGRRFAQTFILEGIGFDIWGIEWQRLERFAALEEQNLSCLAYGEIMYARTPEDARRFRELQSRLQKNLSDPVQQRARSLEAFEQARQLFLNLLFKNGSDVKMAANYVSHYLDRALCFARGRCFRGTEPAARLEELGEMGGLPQNYAQLSAALVDETDAARLKQLCHRLIAITENALSLPDAVSSHEHNFQDLADWYGELSYTWLRVRCYAARGDVAGCCYWGSFLQMELNDVCEDFELPKMELMSAFDPQNLPAFAAHADRLEQQMRSAIRLGGGQIREYAAREDFLHEV